MGLERLPREHELVRKHQLSPAQQNVLRTLGTGWKLWEARFAPRFRFRTHKNQRSIQAPQPSVIKALVDRGLLEVPRWEADQQSRNYGLTGDGWKVIRAMAEHEKRGA